MYLNGDRTDVHVDPVAVPVQFVHVILLNWRLEGKSALFDSRRSFSGQLVKNGDVMTTEALTSDRHCFGKYEWGGPRHSEKSYGG